MSMYPLYLYNTKTGQKDKFTPLVEGKVSLYACGPTVYNYVHIGNLRTFLVEDLLVRTLRYFGYKVHYIMNFTDIDDKTLKRSQLEGKTLEELTDFYAQAFLKDIETLKMEKANSYPRATDFIPLMIECIQILMDKGVAYLSEDGSVYYSIKQYKDYGNLSHIKPEELIEGASERIQSDEYDKHNVGDFVLWKKRVPSDGDITWESPWGEGRPGWHIECSVMSHYYLGNSFDIHCGGIDNKFPHHENEIAQSIVAYGGDFAHWFFHVKHLKYSDQKMSKSLGNTMSLESLIEEGYSPDIIRYALLSTHYRQELIFQDSLLEQSRESLSRIRTFIKEITEISKEDEKENVSRETKKQLEILEDEFMKALSDDLNFAKAIGALFGSIKSFYKNSLSNISSLCAKEILNVFASLDSVLGFIFPWKEFDNLLQDEEKTLFLKREEARKNKDYKEADRIRQMLLEKGWEIIDSPQGSVLKKKY